MPPESFSSSPRSRRFKAPRNRTGRQPEFRIRQQWSFLYQQILEGNKDLEIRVNTALWRDIKQGQEVMISCQDQRIEAVILAIRSYRNVSELLASEDPDRIAPGMSRLQIEQGLRRVYEKSRNSGANRLMVRLDEIGLLAFEFRAKMTENGLEA